MMTVSVSPQPFILYTQNRIHIPFPAPYHTLPPQYCFPLFTDSVRSIFHKIIDMYELRQRKLRMLPDGICNIASWQSAYTSLRHTVTGRHHIKSTSLLTSISTPQPHIPNLCRCGTSRPRCPCRCSHKSLYCPYASPHKHSRKARPLSSLWAIPVRNGYVR